VKQALLAADICPGLATASFEEFAVVDDVTVIDAQLRELESPKRE
jgi:hypothetical protein